MATPENQTKDQLAREPPRKVQSTLVQSPLPLKIIGKARLSGRIPLQIALPGRHVSACHRQHHHQACAPDMRAFIAASPRKTCTCSYKNKSIPLHNTHRARVQAHHILQIQNAKSQQCQARNADHCQHAPWSGIELGHYEVQNHGSCQKNGALAARSGNWC